MWIRIAALRLVPDARLENRGELLLPSSIRTRQWPLIHHPHIFRRVRYRRLTNIAIVNSNWLLRHWLFCCWLFWAAQSRELFFWSSGWRDSHSGGSALDMQSAGPYSFSFRTTVSESSKCNAITGSVGAEALPGSMLRHQPLKYCGVTARVDDASRAGEPTRSCDATEKLRLILG